MKLIVGALMSSFGLVAFLIVRSYIEHDIGYTYAPPFTDHELGMLLLLFGCVLLIVVGIIMVAFSIIRAKGQHRLDMPNSSPSGISNRICPVCKQNIPSGTYVCPRCGHKSENEEDAKFG